MVTPPQITDSTLQRLSTTQEWRTIMKQGQEYQLPPLLRCKRAARLNPDVLEIFAFDMPPWLQIPELEDDWTTAVTTEAAEIPILHLEQRKRYDHSPAAPNLAEGCVPFPQLDEVEVRDEVVGAVPVARLHPKHSSPYKEHYTMNIFK